MADEETPDPGQAFAALMSGAADAAEPDRDEAPYGYTRDRETGEYRPKKAAGRPRTSPSLDELKAERDEQGDEPRDEDRAPRPPRRGKKGKTPPPDVPYKAGVIATGMDRLYRRAGKLIAGFDPVLGKGFIEAATKQDEDTPTVGEAWDELARTNPRIRRFLTKLITGTGYAQLAWAHLPILLAVLATVEAHRKGEHPNQKKPRTLSEKLVASGTGLVMDAPGGSDADGTILEGLQPSDLQSMMAMAQGLFAQMGSPERPEPPGRRHVTVPGEVEAA